MKAATDCVDRIVINAYNRFLRAPEGFRIWWRTLMGNDDKLDNAHIMKFAGRFSRRIHKYAQKNGIPLKHCAPGDRKHEITEKLIPTDSKFKGLFCILAGRAPASVYDVKKIQKRFVSALQCINALFIDHEKFETWHHPSYVGATRVGGIDINRSRIRAVMESVIAFSINSHGFTVSDLAEKIRGPMDNSTYLPRHASYDLKKNSC